MEKSLTVATPCYNEADSLPSYFGRIEYVLGGLAEEGWRAGLLLIDDGSRDRTPEMLEDYARRQPGVRVVHHPRNLGYGAAIKTALALADTEWVVFVDSDSNYDQGLILDLVKLAEPENHLINVSILSPGGSAGYPWYRLLLSSSVSRIYRTLLPRLTRGIYTMSCGFRLYRRSIVPQVFPLADDFVATSEIMIRALMNRARVVELPATNARREHGVSKMRFLRVAWGHLKLAAQALLRRLPAPASIPEHLARIGVAPPGRAVPGAPGPEIPLQDSLRAKSRL
jgi:glycosyltransferase involved in cell wall biosynthesis